MPQITDVVYSKSAFGLFFVEVMLSQLEKDLFLMVLMVGER